MIAIRRHPMIVLFVIAFAVRALFMAISDNSDGDAFARLTLSRQIVDQHAWNPSDVWLPGHFWFLAVPAAGGLRAQAYARLLTVFAGAATVPALYGLTAALFGPAAAFACALILALNPLHIRFSVVTLSEAPFLLLLTLATWGAWTDLRRPSWRAWLAAVAAFNAAGAMRVEGWVLTAFLVGALTLAAIPRFGWSGALLRGAALAVPSSAFAAAWMLYCARQFGDPFYNLAQTRATNADFAVYQQTSFLYIAVFWPMAVLAALGPLSTYDGIAGMRRGLARPRTLWIGVAFAALLALYYFQNFTSGMITQARYALLLVWFLILAAGVTLAAPHGGGRRRLTVAVAALWLLITWGVAERDWGLVSSKLRSIAPRPLAGAEVRALDGWLRTQPDVGALTLGPVPNYGPWLSRFDDWYRNGAVATASSIAELRAVMARGGHGYAVVDRHAGADGALQSSSDGLRIETAFATDGAVVYRWRWIKTSADAPPTRSRVDAALDGPDG